VPRHRRQRPGPRGGARHDGRECLAGEIPFGDVLIVPPGAPPGGVVAVTTAADVLAALAPPPPATALAADLRALASGDAARGDDGALADVRRLVAYV
jgi:hypothetical protein